jgi:para-nitrobenzyl esterase
LSQEPWEWTDADHALANTMAAYWTNFARTGDPNGGGLPVWPNFTAKTERLLHFEGTATVGGVPNLEGLRLLDERLASFRAPDPALLK